MVAHGTRRCDFNASASRDPDGTIANYRWNFGDGTTSPDAVVRHIYSASQYYDVTPTVTDNSGRTDSAFVRIFVDARPVSSFTVSCERATCTFNGSGSSDADGTVVDYLWSFGDGSTGSGAIATHTYLPGTYPVTLMVTDDVGAPNTSGQTVSIVNLPPVASFTYSCKTGPRSS